MGPVRHTLIPMLVAGAVAASVAFIAPADADARPKISSFYVKDEGSVIRLKVNYCDDAAPPTGSYSATFSLFDENCSSSVKIWARRLSGRLHGACGSAYFTIPDDFTNGVYSANVAVANRATGSLGRLTGRYFTIG
jgi:hypothetical protein